MAYATIQPQGNVTVTLTANQRIVVQTQGVAQVYQVVGYPNYPTHNSLLQNVNNTTYTSSAFANGARSTSRPATSRCSTRSARARTSAMTATGTSRTTPSRSTPPAT